MEKDSGQTATSSALPLVRSGCGRPFWGYFTLPRGEGTGRGRRREQRKGRRGGRRKGRREGEGAGLLGLPTTRVPDLSTKMTFPHAEV